MIETRHLIHFLAIAEKQGFATAAKSLNLTQPALSRSIQNLESVLGVALFNRSKKKVTLTTYGQTFLPKAKAILQTMADVRQEIALKKGLQLGSLKVGFGSIYDKLLAAPAASRFVKHYPAIGMIVAAGQFNDMVAKLDNQEIELFIGEFGNLQPPQRYRVQTLKTRHGVFFCRADHPYFSSKHPCLENLANYPLASPPLPKRVNLSVTSQHPPYDHIALNMTICCYSFDTLTHIVAHSDAIGLTVKAFIGHQVKTSRFKILPITNPSLVTHAGIVSLAGRQLSPAAKIFCGIIKIMDQHDGFTPG